MSDTPDLRRNDGKHCYEILVDGQPAGHLAWEDQGPVRALVHTEIDQSFEGRGLAGQLVRFALDDVRQGGLRAQPTCTYVARWLERHPEYHDVVET